jgi:hypothetical protein
MTQTEVKFAEHAFATYFIRPKLTPLIEQGWLLLIWP